MHTMILVIGDDPNAQVDAHGRFDWWGPGGRYTGQLPLKPGRSGKTYAPHHGDGVDQARAEDVDIGRLNVSAVLHEGTLVQDVGVESAEPDLDEVVRELVSKAPPDTLVTIVDAHY